MSGTHSMDDPLAEIRKACGELAAQPVVLSAAHGWRTRAGLWFLSAFEQRLHRPKLAAAKTRHNLVNDALRLMKVVREAGFKIEEPANVDERHAAAAATWIRTRVEAGEITVGTASTLQTALRRWVAAAGRADLAQTIADHLPLSCTKRQLNAEAAKDWESNGVNLDAVLERADQELEPWMGMVLRAQAAYGLRMQEALQFRPLADARTEEGTGRPYLHLVNGTKGGRPRDVYLEEAAQRALLDQLQTGLSQFYRRAAQTRALGNAFAPIERSLAQVERKYYQGLVKLGITKKAAGVTGHGLRAGFADRMLYARGILTVVRGGDGLGRDEAHDEQAHALVAEMLGHSRRQVIGAYVGASVPPQHAFLDGLRVSEEMRERLGPRPQRMRRLLMSSANHASSSQEAP